MLQPVETGTHHACFQWYNRYYYTYACAACHISAATRFRFSCCLYIIFLHMLHVHTHVFFFKEQPAHTCYIQQAAIFHQYIDHHQRRAWHVGVHWYWRSLLHTVLYGDKLALMVTGKKYMYGCRWPKSVKGAKRVWLRMFVMDMPAAGRDEIGQSF